MTTAIATSKRADLWKTIRTLRQQRKTAKTPEAKAKIRAAYRKAVAELEATRKTLSSKKVVAGKKSKRAA